MRRSGERLPGAPFGASLRYAGLSAPIVRHALRVPVVQHCARAPGAIPEAANLPDGTRTPGDLNSGGHGGDELGGLPETLNTDGRTLQQGSY